jgi:hypothetical protein
MVVDSGGALLEDIYRVCVYNVCVCEREREIEDYTGAMFQAEVAVRAAAST